jgi:hypothetical protein
MPHDEAHNAKFRKTNKFCMVMCYTLALLCLALTENVGNILNWPSKLPATAFSNLQLLFGVFAMAFGVFGGLYTYIVLYVREDPRP